MRAPLLPIPLLILAIGESLGFAAGVPARNAAASGGGGTSGGSCPPLTVAWCTSDLSIRQTSCWNKYRSACNSLVGDAWSSYAGGLAGTSDVAVLPRNLSNGGGTLQTLGVDAYDQAAISGVYSDGSYASIMTVAHQPSRFGNFDVGRRGAVTTAIDPWEGDGATVHACDEYTYKKWYDYGRFEDAAASCKQDWFCVYDLAMMTSTPGLNHYPLMMKAASPQATPLQPRSNPSPDMILVATQQDKNGFWPSDFSYSEFINVVRGYLSDADYQAYADAARVITQYSFVDRWQWHQDMHDSQIGEAITLSEHADNARRQAAYRALLQQFRDQKAGLPASTVATILGAPGTGNKCVGYIDPISGEYVEPTHCNKGKGKGSPPPSWPADSLAGQLQLTVNQIRDTIVAEWGHHNARTGVVDHGCLDPASTRCDWQPKMIADDYLHRFVAEREHDYRRCIDVVHNNFAVGGNFPAITAANLADPPAVDAYMAYATDVRDKYLADLPTTTVGDKTVVGRDFRGGSPIGDKSWFVVNTSYSAGYDVELDGAIDANQVHRLCKAQGHVGGSLHADVSVAGATPLPLIDASLAVRAGVGGDARAYATGNLDVLGINLYRDSGSVAAESFNLVPSDPAKMSTSISLADIFFPIGPLPAHVHVDIGLGVGISGHAGGLAPQDCSDPTKPVLSLNGTFEPYAYASANVTLAVGAAVAGFGAEAGLETDLTLVEARVPVNVNLGFDVRYIDADAAYHPSLVLTTNGHVDLTMLSGSIKAYAEVCVGLCFKAEKQIVSWDGIHLPNKELFKLTKAYPLDALFGYSSMGSGG